MRDDDPRSLNDDFVRTFTVSSLPGDPPNSVRDLKDDEFEITIRKVGVVTDLLFKEKGGGRIPFEVGVKGFGGEFEVKQTDEDSICFIAAGVGITPILPSLFSLDYERLKVLWTVREQDVGMVLDVLDRHPTLGKATEVFITDAKDQGAESVKSIEKRSATVRTRRLQKEDVNQGQGVSRYYLCTALPLRKQLTEWLHGQELVFEDFNF